MVYVRMRFTGYYAFLISAVFAFNVYPLNAEDIASQIQLIATGENRAIIQIEGERHIFTQSDPAHKNITMISVNSEQVVLLVDGKELLLSTDDSGPLVLESNQQSESSDSGVVLWADSRGFFFASGLVNGKPVKFLVDTGADIVTFSQPQADQLDIDYSKGKPGLASTASGIANLRTLKLSQIAIGNIVLYDVPISVVMGRFPEVPLLGGSFLNRLDMSRVGNKMELKKRI